MARIRNAWRVTSWIACQELPLRALRANRVFFPDKDHPERKHGSGKSKGGLGRTVYETVDCVRTAFRPRAIGDPRGRDAVRASGLQPLDAAPHFD
jgi:hypothetical protein